MQNLPKKNLLIYALVAIVVIELVWGIFYLSSPKGETAIKPPPAVTKVSPPQAVTGAAISLSPQKAALKTGQTQKIDINVDTQGQKIGGADVILAFDPAFFEVLPDSITAGNVVKTFITKKIDPVKKQIILSGVQEPNAPAFEGKGTLASITVKALSAGVTDITPIFTKTGDTKDSNLVETITGKDLLAKVAGGTYTIAK